MAISGDFRWPPAGRIPWPPSRTWLHNPRLTGDKIEVDLPDKDVPPSLRTYLDKVVMLTNEAMRVGR